VCVAVITYVPHKHSGFIGVVLEGKKFLKSRRVRISGWLQSPGTGWHEEKSFVDVAKNANYPWWFWKNDIPSAHIYHLSHTHNSATRARIHFLLRQKLYW